MKKQLLAGAFVLASFLTAQAQSLTTQDYNALTVGNVGTDLTGVTAGQGDIFTYSVVAANSDFQIVAAGNTGNGLQITGAAVAAGTTNATDNRRFLWENGLDTAWESRTAGNDIISVTYKIFSGVVNAASTNSHTLAIYNYSADGTTSTVIGGYAYNGGTGELRGLANYTSGGQSGLFNFGLSSEAGGVVLTPNTWYTITVSVDTTTGDVIWSSNDITVTNADGTSGTLAGGVSATDNAGLEPSEIDFVTYAGTANAASTTVIYDDLNSRAVASFDDVLATKPVAAIVAELSVFPNPATDVVNVSGQALVSNISVTDLNGRTVKNVNFSNVSEAQVNVSDLASGVYFVTVASDKGTTTKKIVKN